MTTGIDWHPTPGEILDLHFGEAGAATAALAAHVAGCAACRPRRGELSRVEALLATGSEEPPADGLERVLAAVAPAARPAAPRRAWVRAVAPTAAVVGVGACVIRVLAARLLAADLVPEAALAPVTALSGFGLAAAAFFAAGSLFTLALAPFLILEAQGGAWRAASR
jgi:hypothetical protein